MTMTEERWRNAEYDAEFELRIGGPTWAYIWEVGEAYGVVGDEIHDFLSDIREAFVRTGWRPEHRPTDLDWSMRFPDIEPFGEK